VRWYRPHPRPGVQTGGAPPMQLTATARGGTGGCSADLTDSNPAGRWKSFSHRCVDRNRGTAAWLGEGFSPDSPGGKYGASALPGVRSRPEAVTRDILALGRTGSQSGRSRCHVRIRFPPTGLYLPRPQHSDRRLHHRGRPGGAHSHPHRRARDPTADRPGARTSVLGGRRLRNHRSP